MADGRSSLDPSQLAAIREYRERSRAGRGESVAEFLQSHGFLEDVMRSVLHRLEADEQLAESGSPPERERFELKELLGSGGMGTVHLAWDRTLQRLVALKQIRAELLALPEARRRFELEARAASALSHPNLCAVFDVGEQDGIPFIVMPYVEGRPLDALIAGARDRGERGLGRDGQSGLGTSEQRGTFRVVELVEMIARAIHHAHERGLVHRDLKPGNVIVRADGEPVVLDFGLVHQDDAPAMTRSGLQPGTREYMAPEQVQPRGRVVDRRTDVWSLGVILFECLTLERPFRGDSEHELFQSILAARPRSMRAIDKRIPRDLDVVVATALAPEPERRYQTALELAEDLRRVRSFQPIHARRAGIPLRVLRWCRREPWAAATLGIVLVALVVVALLFRDSTTNLKRFDLLSNVSRLQRATEAAATLLPAHPRIAGGLAGWLSDYGDPLERFAAGLDEEIERLARAVPVDPAARAASGAAFLHDAMLDARQRLAKFCAPDGLLEQMRARLAWAESVQRRSIDEYSELWDATCRAIHDPDGERVSSAYRGFELAPQLGLVPLGPDPQSRLMEFYDLRSADPTLPIPSRDPSSGALQLEEHAGIVFVLVPATKGWIGGQKDEPAKPCFDPAFDDAVSAGNTAREVELGAFLLGKHEVTQFQWVRLGGVNRSGCRAGGTLDGVVFTGRNPVEMVSWVDGDRLLASVGLRLPLSDEWELACRAGRTTIWSFGDRMEDIASHANVVDVSMVRVAPDLNSPEDRAAGRLPAWDDGHAEHAAAGTFRPNDWGLLDMHGNVMEWCADGPPNDETRYLRGGSYQFLARHSSCWRRIPVGRAERQPYVGLRATRSVEPR